MSLARASLSIATIALLFAAACSPQAPSEPGVGARGSASSGGGGGETASGSGGGSGSGGETASSSSGGTASSSSGGSGGTTSSSGGSGGGHGGAVDAGTLGPPPSLPPSPGGFQQTISPLLDANGCTECHHKGRPIDVTAYPFMTGSASDTAQALVKAFTTDMPPAPRPQVPQTVIDQVNGWIDAGMLP
jgi:hypothetical protein